MSNKIIISFLFGIILSLLSVTPSFAAGEVIKENILHEETGLYYNVWEIYRPAYGGNYIAYTAVGISGVKEGVKDVVIPEKINELMVQSIDYQAFKDNTEIESVVFSDYIDYVSDGAFENCTSLKNVKLSSSLQQIAKNVFVNCSSLESIVIPGKVDYMWDGCFSGCTNLEKVEFEDGVNTIDFNCFPNCPKLDEMKLPMSVKDINGKLEDIGSKVPLFKVYYDSMAQYILEGMGYALDAELMRVLDETTGLYYQCDLNDEYGYAFITGAKEGVTKVNIPKKIKNRNVYGVQDFAFFGNKEITEVSMADSVNWIGDSAFEGCSNLEKVKNSENLLIIMNNAFAKCIKLKNINMPFGLNYIGDKAFLNCKDLKVIVISIGGINYNNIYQGCTGLEKAIITDDVGTLNFDFINKLTSLKEIHMLAGDYIRQGDNSVFRNPNVTFYVEDLSSPQGYCLLEGLNYKIEEPVSRIMVGSDLISQYSIIPCSRRNSTDTITENDFKIFYPTSNISMSKNNNLGTGTEVTIDNKKYKLALSGDVNGDSEIDIFDVTTIVSVLVDENKQLPFINQIAGDVINDNEIDIYDITRIVNAIVEDDFRFSEAYNY